MKITTTLILAIFALLTLYSCTADDSETTSFEKEKEVNINSDFSKKYTNQREYFENKNLLLEESKKWLLNYADWLREKDREFANYIYKICE